MTQPLTLDRAPYDVPLVLVSASVPDGVLRRLSALGLRRGASLSLLHGLAGGGRVVAVGGGRIAVSREVLAHLLVERAA